MTYNTNRLQLGPLEKEGWLYRALQGKPIVFSKDIITKTTTMTSGYDVARGIISIIGKSEALSEVFHIMTNNHISQEKIINVYLNVLEKYLGVRPVVKLIDLKSFNSLGLPTYQVKYDRLYDRVFNTDKINNFIPVDSFESAEIGLERCLSEFLKDPKFSGINILSEAKKNIVSNSYSVRDIIRVGRHKIGILKNSIIKLMKNGHSLYSRD